MPFLKQVWIATFVVLIAIVIAPQDGIGAEPSANKADQTHPERLQLLNPALRKTPYADLVEFADERFEEEDYYNALTFYQLALTKTKSRKNQEILRFRIAHCFLMGEKWEEAENAFDDFIAEHPRSDRAAEASYRIGQGYFRGGNFLAAINNFKETERQYPQSEHAIWSQYALGLSYARLGTWQEAQSQLKQLAEKHPDHKLAAPANRLADLIGEGKPIKDKSPFLAGFLSLIPGLGKVYTHHYGGAIIAAIINGSLGFLIYDSFDNDRDAVGAIFSTLAAATYSSNVIGGYRSAKRYNARKEDQFAERLMNEGMVPELGLHR